MRKEPKEKFDFFGGSWELGSVGHPLDWTHLWSRGGGGTQELLFKVPSQYLEISF